MAWTTYADANEAYLATLERVWRTPEGRSAPRGQVVKELYDYGFEVERKSGGVFPIKTGHADRDAAIESYTHKEFHLYNAMTDDAKVFSRASSFWNRIANPDGTVNSAYGKLIFKDQSCGDGLLEGMKCGIACRYDERLRTPFEWALLSLLADVDSRQAYIRLSLPRHQWWGNADQVCTMHLHLRVLPAAGEVPDRLMMTTVMRSNDVVKGLVYDMPYFMYVQEAILQELHNGRRIPYGGHTSLPNIFIGPYRHFAHSMHAYVRDEDVIETMLQGRGKKEESNADRS